MQLHHLRMSCGLMVLSLLYLNRIRPHYTINKPGRILAKEDEVWSVCILPISFTLMSSKSCSYEVVAFPHPKFYFINKLSIVFKVNSLV